MADDLQETRDMPYKMIDFVWEIIDQSAGQATPDI